MTNETSPSNAALSDGDALVQYLESRDVNCPACGYNLRQLRSPKCPECGEALRLSVGLADPRIGTWVSCLIGCCLPAAFGCMVLLFVVPELFRNSRMPNLPWQVGLLFTYLVFTVPAVIALVINRRRYLRMKRDRQVIFAIAPWAVNASIAFMMYAGSLR